MNFDEIFTNPETIRQTISQLSEQIAIEDEKLVRLDRELKSRRNKLEADKQKLASILVSAGITSIKLESGLNPSVNNVTKYFRQSGISDEQLFAWLSGNGMDGIIKPTVHHGTLNSAVKAFVESGGNVPESVINVSQHQTVRLNGKSRFLAERQEQY